MTGPPQRYDLAWTHGAEAFGTRRAIPSRDLSRVVFVSDWDGDRAEAFSIEIPPDALPE